MTMRNGNVILTHKLPSQTSFGLDTGTGEQVFIPAPIVRNAQLEIGDTFECDMLPNAGDRQGNTPWKVFNLAERSHPAAAPIKLIAASNDKIDHDIQRWLSLNFFAKTSEVFKALPDLNTTEKQIGNRLLALFNAGLIAKADVFAAGGQSRPSFCLWATDAGSFIEVDV